MNYCNAGGTRGKPPEQILDNVVRIGSGGYVARRRGYRTNLAELERRLAALNAERERVLVNIKAVVAGLTAGAADFLERERRELRPVTKAVRRTRRFSKAARAKLAAAARKRWAEAKKAGKTRLG